jgi:hypothetical protein
MLADAIQTTESGGIKIKIEIQPDETITPGVAETVIRPAAGRVKRLAVTLRRRMPAEMAAGVKAEATARNVTGVKQAMRSSHRRQMIALSEETAAGARNPEFAWI